MWQFLDEYGHTEKRRKKEKKKGHPHHRDALFLSAEACIYSRDGRFFPFSLPF